MVNRLCVSFAIFEVSSVTSGVRNFIQTRIQINIPFFLFINISAINSVDMLICQVSREATDVDIYSFYPHSYLCIHIEDL